MNGTRRRFVSLAARIESCKQPMLVALLGISVADDRADCRRALEQGRSIHRPCLVRVLVPSSSSARRWRSMWTAVPMGLQE